MAHTLSDLMDNFISIAQSGALLYSNLASQADISLRVKTIARIFAKEEERQLLLYQRLKERITDSVDMEVDFRLYSKAEKLINDLKTINNTDRIKDLKELLEFSLNFERENLVLVLEIQNLSGTANSTLISILEEIASEERKHIANIEGYVK